MKFKFSKSIKFKKNSLTSILSKCQLLIPFDCELDDTSDSEYYIIVNDNMDNLVDINLYITDEIKSSDAEKQIIAIIGYYYV